MSDIIDQLAGIDPGSAFDRARQGRPEARRAAQESHDLLFHPANPGGISLRERRAVALFVALLHGHGEASRHYKDLLDTTDPDLSETIEAEAEKGRAVGPYGSYPKGPLSVEDADGPTYEVSLVDGDGIDRRLAAALEHAHLLVLHPRDASRAALQKLLDAGWTTAAIVTLSQIVSFLAFQIRVIHGLRLAQTAHQSRFINA